MRKQHLTVIGLTIIALIVGYLFLNIPLIPLLLGETSFLLLYVLFLYISEKHHVENTEVTAPTEEKADYLQLEEKYREVLQRAEKLEQEKKMTELFLASMSHEIRTPLNGIIGLTEVLDGMELNAEQKEFVSMIRESSNNLRVIVDDVLEISKLDAGKMELESIPFDLRHKIESSVGLFKPRFDEKEIVQTTHIDPDIPHVVLGDPTRMTQVLTNLISNAIKFTQKGGRIDVSAKTVEKSDDEVTLRISVADSGIGLSKEQQEKIFDAYAQASASTTRKSGGTGLGLTISKKIIDSMDGELGVESEEGKGATFYFIIRLKVDKTAIEAAVPEEQAVPREAVPVQKSRQELQVLVAEDNPINQKLIQIVLEKLGLHVMLVDDGEKALEARKTISFDMIFMDVQMPVMGGVEATHAILEYEKEHGLKHIPIIALTANALAGDREKYIQEGMDDYTTKPLDTKAIEKLVKKYCGV